MRYLSIFSVLVLGAALSGCANMNSIFRDQEIGKAPEVLLIDAKQRAIISADHPLTVKRRDAGGSADDYVQTYRAFCAEPSPDVFSVLSQAASASGTFDEAAPSNITAGLQAALSNSETGSSISRTQTVNMLRELMYRTCERYMSGALTENQFPIQAVRDQRVMVSILAIEQLTGAITPPVVTLSANASAASGTAGTATGTTASNVTPPAVDPNRAQQIASVAAIVGEIVKENFSQDEFLLFCIRVLPVSGNGNGPIEKSCLSYVQAQVDKQTAQAKHDAAALTLDAGRLAAASGQIGAASGQAFAGFWKKVGSATDPAQADATSLKTVISAYLDPNAPGALFAGRLIPVWKRKLTAMESMSSKADIQKAFAGLHPSIQADLSQ